MAVSSLWGRIRRGKLVERRHLVLQHLELRWARTSSQLLQCERPLADTKEAAPHSRNALGPYGKRYPCMKPHIEDSTVTEALLCAQFRLESPDNILAWDGSKYKQTTHARMQAYTPT